MHSIFSLPVPAGLPVLNVAIIDNLVTGERGLAVKVANGTGSPSVKGSLVSASTSADQRFVLQSNEFDTFGIVYESGIADGEAVLGDDPGYRTSAAQGWHSINAGICGHSSRHGRASGQHCSAIG